MGPILRESLLGAVYKVDFSHSKMAQRTGFKGPTQSVQFKFAEYGSEKKAVAAAQKWVADQCKARKIAPP